MYKSPIEVTESFETIYKNTIDEMHKAHDEAICAEIVSKVHVDVDQQELMKALRYDRGQYDKGYADGMRDAVIHARWDDNYCCTNCGKEALLHEGEDGCDIFIGCACSDFCPHCGAKMEGERHE